MRWHDPATDRILHGIPHDVFDLSRRARTLSPRRTGAWRGTMVTAKLALLATALFTFVEHPARMLGPAPWAVAQWRPSYKRATVMQASLAVIGSLAAVLAWGAGAT
jgi:hypothetical protein